MSTVLVVDDEPIVRDVVVRYLERDPSAPQHLETVWGVGYRFVP